ncbi:MAG: ATP-binding protein, partial [Acidobacteriota bacterium]|nr:ATP-binding protein [Acidobacteriota bacterium]
IIQDSISFNLSGSNVKAHNNFPDDLWQIKADKEQISQVISNLIINANQAMSDGGNLYIKIENIENLRESTAWHLKGNFVKLSIQDEGVGIPAEHIKKIYDPYFSTKQTGSGLGLTIARNIIIQHNGHINVTSKPGIGTTFTIFLPAEKFFNGSITATHQELINKPTTISGHILIMDDEEMVRNVAAEMLKKYGCTVDFAVDGKTAIEKYISANKSRHSFDIVIMDLTIPGGMGGKEAVNKLLAIDPKAKVIVSSGYSIDPIIANYNKYGFKGKIVKPFKIETLKTEVYKVIKMK